MAWKKNKRLVAAGFADLVYLPRERSGWDATLASLAYGMRMALERGRPDLGAWAARRPGKWQAFRAATVGETS